MGPVVRCGAGRTAWGLAAVFGLVSGVFGVGGALVPVFNLVMGVPLRWLVLRLPSRLGMRRRTSRLGLSFSVSTEVGAVLARVAAFGGDRAAGGFAFCRGYAVTCRRLHGGVL
jgi:hypothetical protein